ncbi:MAG: ComEC/Rec2 family competence protein [Verrucomicrobia bacterium]|nr:ComEC/Rec2 family competence protein [Verrucomicrobiota bacterium]
MFAAALAMAGCLLLADRGMAAGCLAAGVLGGVGVVFGNWRRGLAWALCGTLAVGVFTWRNCRRDRAGAGLLESGGGQAEGRVLTDAKGGNGSWVAPVRLVGGPYPGAKVSWQGRGETPVAGARVRARGNFVPLPLRRNPGEFDQGAWLRRQGVAAVFRATLSSGRVSTGWLAALGARLRREFRTAVTAGLPDDSQAAMVIRAVVIGDIPPDADELVAAFRNSGTLHIFSVSGMHVAMVASIAWLLLRWAGVPRRWAVLVLLPFIFGYTWISGNSPPALRSAWMASVFLGAFVFRRRPDLLNALGLVLFAALMWNGNLLFQPGVQLSYGVVAAIALGTPWASRRFAWIARPEPYLPPQLLTRWQKFHLRCRRKLAQSLAVSLAALIGSTPLTAFHFGLVTPISLIANLALMPLVFVLLAAALLAAALHPWAPRAAAMLNQANAVVANACVTSASALAAIPGGHFSIRHQSQPFLLIYDLDFGAAAACFSAGPGGAVMLDCGDRNGFKRRVMPSLRQLGATPDAVVLSHPDGRHLGGGAQVWAAFPIRQVLLPVARARSPAYQAWVAEAPRAGLRTLLAAPHSVLPMPDAARLEILHAPDPLNPVTLADDRVAIFRLHWRGWKLLFTSDAGMATETKLLDQAADLSADVIIAGHHSRDRSLCDAFLDQVQPAAIIASNEAFPSGERLDPAQAAFWRASGIQVLDQAQTGAVTLTIDPAGDLLLEGFVDKSSLRLKRR